MAHTFSRTLCGIAVAASLCLVTACGSNNSKKQVDHNQQPDTPDIAVAYQGSWQANGYGMALQVGDDNAKLYMYTSDYCLLQQDFGSLNTADLKRNVRLSNDKNSLNWYAGTGTANFGAPGIDFEKQTTLPNACLGEVLTPNSSLDNGELFALYSQIMEEYYVDFSRMNVDWSALAFELSTSITGNINTLYEAIYQSFIALQDGHNTFESSQGLNIQVLGKPTHVMTLIEEYADANGLTYPLEESELTPAIIADINAYVENTIVQERLITEGYATSNIQRDQSELVSWFTIEGIGYLRIDAMTGYSTVDEEEDDLARITSSLNNINAALDEALHDLSNTDGLILDIRTNGGGNDYISLAIASRFTDTDFIGYKKYARDGNSVTETKVVTIEPTDQPRYTNKPVVLLTSTDTASAAETLAMSLAQLDTVHIVGEATQGIFSDKLEWILPGNYVLALSNEFYLTADNEWLEGQGVPVDDYSPYFTPFARNNQQDPAVLRALAMLE